ncbi:TonB-dependent siderophore receptor [Methylomagnum ishizawai]|uniref:TonB-dependent siderophore receptor n=1 Tax=Methylomagnum ishizawai TaxID=1760988 RepID=UPI000A15EA07
MSGLAGARVFQVGEMLQQRLLLGGFHRGSLSKAKTRHQPLMALCCQAFLRAIALRYLVGIDWTFKFNEDWHITNRFLYNSADYFQPSLWHSNMENDQFLVRGLDNHVKQNRSTYTTNLDLVGKFATGIARHEVLVGFDFFQFNQSSGNSYSDYSSLVPPIDIYNPNNSLVVANTDAIKQLPNNFFYKQDETWYGIYFQDQITLWDKLHILGGGRYNWAEYSTGFSNLSFGNIQMTPVNDDAFNPRVGVLYQPWSWLSVYGNYVESFGTPNGGQSASGQPFSPETAQQGEVGIKTEWFDQRLNATLAFYDITKRNILTPDPNDIRFSVSVGEARSRGVELDFTGKLTPNWSLLGSYAYTDAKITKDNSGNEGNQLMGVPLNSGNLWTKYEFDAGVLEGLSIGTGVFARGQRQGDNANSFQLPGFTRWDASIAYSFKQLGSKITTQFNVYNLLDKTYYASSSGPVGITAGQPITFLGSVRVEF